MNKELNFTNILIFYKYALHYMAFYISICYNTYIDKSEREVFYMKIEKINDNQIKCTLNKSDLASRQIKISELAYGTEKAKSLFRDMMQQASYEFGFEAEDIPLMIEAIPISADCIVLVITKVEDPEELDTRFSKFTASEEEVDFSDNSDGDSDLNGADEILDIFKKLKDVRDEAITESATFIPLPETLSNDKEETVEEAPAKDLPSTKVKVEIPNIVKLYSFNNIDEIINLSYVLEDIYQGYNSLYKSEANERYYLLVNKGYHTPEDFNKVCNILSEYGKKEKGSYASEAFFEEHFNKIIIGRALQNLAKV